MSEYTCVLFDIDETILDFGADEKAALSSALLSFGVEPKDELISLYSKINLSLWKRHEKGEIEKKDVLRLRFYQFIEESGISKEINPEEIAAAYEDNLCLGGTLKDGAMELLKSVKRQGLKIYAVTNGTKRTQTNRFKRSGIDEAFDKIFISEEMGCQKPMKEFFDIVFKSIDEKDRRKIILVGDSLSSDITGAVNAGIDSIWLNENNSTNTLSIAPTYTAQSLTEVLKIILKNLSENA